MLRKLKIILNFGRMSEIEEEIFLIKQEIFELPKKLKGPIAQNVLDGRIENAKKPLLHRLDILTTERDFLISKREAWLPKTIWNLIVPLVVSVATAWIVIQLNLK